MKSSLELRIDNLENLLAALDLQITAGLEQLDRLVNSHE